MVIYLVLLVCSFAVFINLKHCWIRFEKAGYRFAKVFLLLQSIAAGMRLLTIVSPLFYEYPSFMLFGDGMARVEHGQLVRYPWGYWESPLDWSGPYWTGQYRKVQLVSHNPIYYQRDYNVILDGVLVRIRFSSGVAVLSDSFYVDTCTDTYGIDQADCFPVMNKHLAEAIDSLTIDDIVNAISLKSAGSSGRAVMPVAAPDELCRKVNEALAINHLQARLCALKIW